MTYVVLKGYLYDPIDCVRHAVATEPGKVYRKDSSFLFFSILLVLDYSIRLGLVSISIRLVLVSDPGSVSPFFRDELLVPVLHFVSVDRGERGSARRGLYHERSKEVSLFQIYNMDSGNSMELDSHVDPNESSFPRR